MRSLLSCRVKNSLLATEPLRDRAFPDTKREKLPSFDTTVVVSSGRVVVGPASLSIVSSCSSAVAATIVVAAGVVAITIGASVRSKMPTS